MRTQPRAAIASVRFAGDTLPGVSEKTRGLRENFAWTLLGNGIYAATQWGLVVVIAKLGSAELVGQFALGLAVAAPIFLFWRLSLGPVQATDARREFELGHYLALRILTIPAALVCVGVIVLATHYRQQVAWVVLAVAFAKASEALADPFYGALQKRERMDEISKSMIAKGLLAWAGFALVFLLTSSLVWSIATLAAVWAVVIFVFDLRKTVALLTVDECKPRWERRQLFRLALLALPVGIAAMLLSLNTNIPRYFVESTLGERALGIYAAMAYPILALGTVVNALGQTASPRLARLYAERDASGYTRLLLKLIALGVGMGVIAVLVAATFGAEVVRFFYRAEYESHVDILVLFTATFVLSSMASFLGYGMTATRSFRIQPLLFATSAAVGYLLCYLWIPAYGLRGAVYAYGASLLMYAGGALITNVGAVREIGRAADREGEP